MMSSSSSRELTRTLFTILSLCLLLATTFWIMKPFLLALVWAAMITVATWPLLLGVQRALRNRRALAVLMMTGGMLMVLIVPLILAITTIVQNHAMVRAWIRQLTEQGLPLPPEWVGNLPLVGEKAAAFWTQAAATGPAGLTAQLALYADKLLAWFIGNAGNMGMIIVQLALTLILTAILYANGETAVAWVISFFRRLAGNRGEEVVILAGKAIRAVAMGIVVTAVVQSVLGGIGLWIAGVPAVGLLTAVMFLLAIAQIGVGPVLLCSVGWLFYKKMTLWAVALLVWTVVVGSLDNFIRPILIRKGANLPLLLIFAGVLGGLVAFGVIGLFVGPVVLAVSYTLVKAWIEETESDDQKENGAGV